MNNESGVHHQVYQCLGHGRTHSHTTCCQDIIKHSQNRYVMNVLHPTSNNIPLYQSCLHPKKANMMAIRQKSTDFDK